MKFDESSHRSLNPEWVRKKEHGTALADAYPLSVASEESLRELNRRILEAGRAPIRMSRMRPNIVLGNVPRPFDEDLIRELRTKSGICIAGVKPADRCPVTTVDQATGTRGSDPGEPLTTLSTFRRGLHLLDRFPDLPEDLHSNVFFSMNCVVVAGVGETRTVGEEVKLELCEVRRIGDTGN